MKIYGSFADSYQEVSIDYNGNTTNMIITEVGNAAHPRIMGQKVR